MVDLNNNRSLTSKILIKEKWDWSVCWCKGSHDDFSSFRTRWCNRHRQCHILSSNTLRINNIINQFSNRLRHEWTTTTINRERNREWAPTTRCRITLRTCMDSTTISRWTTADISSTATALAHRRATQTISINRSTIATTADTIRYDHKLSFTINGKINFFLSATSATATAATTKLESTATTAILQMNSRKQK